MKDILVTGGTGIIGTRLLFDLLGNQRNVTALKRSSSITKHTQKAFEFYDKKRGLEIFNQINWIEGDIVDSVAMNDLLADYKEVYHCAALVSFKQRDEQQLMLINQKGTENIVNASIYNGIRKLCYISSVAALERNVKEELITEEYSGTSMKKRSNYGHSKFLAELEVWRGIEEGLNAVIVNPSLVLGAGRPEMSSGQLYKTILNGLKYYGTGSNGIIDVRTISSVCIELMEKQIFGERFILSAHNITHKELFTRLATALEVKGPNKKLSPAILKIGSFIASLMSAVGIEPPIGKESLESAGIKMKYDNSKISNFINVEYPSAESSIEYYSEYYKSF